MKQFTGGWKKQGGWAWVAPAITAAAGLIGGKLASKGTAKANQENIQLSREQMAFQERMSNSAYQRAATDMEKAGLNRILAAGSPASTPSGSLATVNNELAPMGEALGSAAQNAMQAAQTAANIANVKADTKNKKAQEDQIRAATEQAQATARQNNAAAHNLENVGKASDQATEFLDSGKPIYDYVLKGQAGRDLGKKIYEGQKHVEDLIEKYYPPVNEAQKKGAERIKQLLKMMSDKK